MGFLFGEDRLAAKKFHGTGIKVKKAKAKKGKAKARPIYGGEFHKVHRWL